MTELPTLAMSIGMDVHQDEDKTVCVVRANGVAVAVAATMTVAELLIVLRDTAAYVKK